MKKLYEKNEVTFAIVWIVIYCVAAGTARSFGDDSPWMLAVLGLIAAALCFFIRQNGLESKYGLDHWPKDSRRFLYFIPMWVLCTGNLWGGIRAEYGEIRQVCAMLSMALVGYVEEVIFRGFLFRGMLKNGSERSAIIVSAATFGIGHIVNLLTGQASLETLVQIPFAVAWGFIFTLVYYRCGSLLPCILAHSLIDVFSTFAVDNPVMDWVYVILTIVVAAVYGLYLWKVGKAEGSNQ